MWGHDSHLTLKLHLFIESRERRTRAIPSFPVVRLQSECSENATGKLKTSLNSRLSIVALWDLFDYLNYNFSAHVFPTHQSFRDSLLRSKGNQFADAKPKRSDWSQRFRQNQLPGTHPLFQGSTNSRRFNLARYEPKWWNRRLAMEGRLGPERCYATSFD